MKISPRNRALGSAAVAMCLLAGGVASAQGSNAQPRATGATGAAAAPYSAAVNANNVFVRSSPSVNSSYPFAKLSTGDIVEVLEESYGWARVRCTGPAFEGIFGYVPADRRVELSSDGSTLKVSSRTEIKAPNIGGKESPDASWKPIAKLAPGDTLRVLGTVEGEREKVFKVALTEAAEGFVNLNYLRRASPAEATAYRAAGSRASIASAPTAAPATTAATGNAATPAGAGSAATRTLADEHRITARPRGGDAPSSDAATETVTTTTVDAERVTVTLPDGEKATAEVDTITTQSRRAAEAPSTALSAAEIERAASRSEFDDLESIWDTVKLQPLENAEVSVLRNRYADLLTRPNVPGDVRQMAKARTEQLSLKLEIQERLYTLDRMKAQRSQDLDRIRAISLAMEARSDFDAVGVLNASTVFDGNRLPALYRLQDPAVGQTVAYVVPRDDFQLSTMLGVLVGVKGEKRYDASLRVNVIEPRAIDILTQRRDPQWSSPSDSSNPREASPAPANTPPTSAGSTEPVYYAPVPPDAP